MVKGLQIDHKAENKVKCEHKLLLYIFTSRHTVATDGWKSPQYKTVFRPKATFTHCCFSNSFMESVL